MNYQDGVVIPKNGIEQKMLIAVYKNDGGIYRGEVQTVERANDDSLIKISVLVGDMFSIMTFYVDEILEARYTKLIRDMPQPTRKTEPNELHFVDAYSNPVCWKIGNSEVSTGDVITAFTLEENGMIVVHGQKGVIAVIKSERVELYYS